jgi:hypothetical protein
MKKKERKVREKQRKTEKRKEKKTNKNQEEKKNISNDISDQLSPNESLVQPTERKTKKEESSFSTLCLDFENSIHKLI